MRASRRACFGIVLKVKAVVMRENGVLFCMSSSGCHWEDVEEEEGKEEEKCLWGS